MEPRLVRSFPYDTVFEYHFKRDVVFDRWSTHVSIHVHRKAFPAINCWRILEDFHCQEFSNSLTLIVASSFVCTSPLAVITVVGLLDVGTVSNSAEFKTFLLIMCIDAPEAGRHQFSESERNVVLCFSFNFRIFLASLRAASRAHRSCHSVSSWDRSCNFGALGLRWWGSPGQIIPSDGLWSWMLAWRHKASVNRTYRIGFSMFELFRKIDEDFGGSISWDTQPNCRVFFSIATAILSPLFLDFMLGCSSICRCV